MVRRCDCRLVGSTRGTSRKGDSPTRTIYECTFLLLVQPKATCTYVHDARMLIIHILVITSLLSPKPKRQRGLLLQFFFRRWSGQEPTEPKWGVSRTRGGAGRAIIVSQCLWGGVEVRVSRGGEGGHGAKLATCRLHCCVLVL